MKLVGGAFARNHRPAAASRRRGLFARQRRTTPVKRLCQSVDDNPQSSISETSMSWNRSALTLAIFSCVILGGTFTESVAYPDTNEDGGVYWAAGKWDGESRCVQWNYSNCPGQNRCESGWFNEYPCSARVRYGTIMATKEQLQGCQLRNWNFCTHY